MHWMLEVVIVSDVYPSLACRIPTYVALLRSEPLLEAIGSYHFYHYWQPQAFLRYDNIHNATIRF